MLTLRLQTRLRWTLPHMGFRTAVFVTAQNVFFMKMYVGIGHTERDKRPGEPLTGFHPAVKCVQRRYVCCMSSMDTTATNSQRAARWSCFCLVSHRSPLCNVYCNPVRLCSRYSMTTLQPVKLSAGSTRGISQG